MSTLYRRVHNKPTTWKIATSSDDLGISECESAMKKIMNWVYHFEDIQLVYLTHDPNPTLENHLLNDMVIKQLQGSPLQNLGVLPPHLLESVNSSTLVFSDDDGLQKLVEVLNEEIPGKTAVYMDGALMPQFGSCIKNRYKLV
eukprot:TRINITY_DN3110_c0_g1_i1.p1 TRINITY_DN3110_c0_g1~~TRINITY_DN3110_c0_g1_i1.p1  ORF type:complete len:143 (+),score=27.10 TRINITY_DN3110_c0_g1_i1:150-578(+)